LRWFKKCLFYNSKITSSADKNHDAFESFDIKIAKRSFNFK
jgi:hypothetical protein